MGKTIAQKMMKPDILTFLADVHLEHIPDVLLTCFFCVCNMMFGGLFCPKYGGKFVEKASRRGRWEGSPHTGKTWHTWFKGNWKLWTLDLCFKTHPGLWTLIVVFTLWEENPGWASFNTPKSIHIYVGVIKDAQCENVSRCPVCMTTDTELA